MTASRRIATATAPEGSVSGESFAKTLNSRQLDCRELGHKWRPHTVTWDRKARAYDRQLKCSSCRTIRKQLLDSRGAVLKNSYEYPEGYLAGKQVNVGELSRDVFRLEAIVRYLNHTEAKAS